MTATVVRAGLLTTVQDGGRHGSESFGIGPGGAMDDVASRIGNALVGNPLDAAILEMTLTGSALRVDVDTLVAITGAASEVAIDGAPAPMHRAMLVRAGSTVDVGRTTQGCRSYLAIGGGIDVDVVLSSRSTHLRATFGGFDGRALKVGDRIPTGTIGREGDRLQTTLAARGAGWMADRSRVHDSIGVAHLHGHSVRVMVGPQFELLDDVSRELLVRTPYTVSPQSDRMGCRLAGAALRFASPIEMTSEAVVCGTIQLPPDGQPIVLLADRQTTGGYPVIGHVASVDLAAMGQRRAGDTITFTIIEHRDAQQLLLERERALLAALHALSLQRTNRE